MKFLKSLAIIIHTLIFLCIGGIMLGLALNLFNSNEILNALNYVSSEQNFKIAFIAIGSFIIFASLLNAHIKFGYMQSEKTIAFENPEGQVTVSLSAIEDFIKKSVKHLPEVKEMRANVFASKKGISVVARATIFADSNIPETTERIQSIIKTKVQEMLGVEETINIKINVTKISIKEKDRMPEAEYKGSSRHMPFQGAD